MTLFRKKNIVRDRDIYNNLPLNCVCRYEFCSVNDSAIESRVVSQDVSCDHTNAMFARNKTTNSLMVVMIAM